MTTDVITEFESLATPPESFRHADHIRLAFEYLSQYPPLEALSRFCQALKKFAAAHGKPNLYHETITCAYLYLIRERMARATEPLTWQEFSRQIRTCLSGRAASSICFTALGRFNPSSPARPLSCPTALHRSRQISSRTLSAS